MGETVQGMAAHEYQVYPYTQVRYLVPENLKSLGMDSDLNRYLCFLASKYSHIM